MIHEAIKTFRTLPPAITGSVTREQIEEKVNILLTISLYKDIDRQQLIREIEALYNVRADNFRIIEDAERNRPWLNEKKADIRWNFWNRYRDYLETVKGFAPDTLRRLHTLTDTIVDKLFDPTINASIDKRGLVVGQVQSGKTANYTGLICKAADAGFKLTIILAGSHNNLRSQTQIRVDEGFLGFDTRTSLAFNNANRRIGVGRINRDIVAHSLTTSLDSGDFNAGAANMSGINFDTNEPVVLVVKKNPHVLRRLQNWLLTQAEHEVEGKRVIDSKSLLLIDDEADYASINTKIDSVTTINGLIRDILRLFTKSSYVGYTATPFANIFIPIGDDDLFPRDFIINLPAPSNYIGPERVFGFSYLQEDDDHEDRLNTLPIVRRINDYETEIPNGHHKSDPTPQSIPESLRLAIKTFILTCSIRRLRGQVREHNSMLIHVTRFTNWQNKIKELVEETFEYYQRGIDQNDPTIIEELRKVFEVDSEANKSFVTTTAQILDSELRNLDSEMKVHTWSEVYLHLNDAASRIVVKEINGGSGDALNYFDHTDGLSVIAIGGDKLSRGLTLEGLSVSYYLRASRMYDTLMQMGRWFGYRPGYPDLCRLFTSRELNEWYCHITLASEELRDEFNYMSDVAGSTPIKYALKVRTHPGLLQISASNKIRSAVTMRFSFAGRLVETYEFPKDEKVIDSNFNHAHQFISTLGAYQEKEKESLVWKNIHAQQIIQFLSGYRMCDNLRRADSQNLIRFINMQLPTGEITHWTVVLMSRSNPEKTAEYIVNNKNTEVGLFRRKQEPKLSNDSIYYLRKSHIISPEHEFIDLSSDQKVKAMDLTTQKRIRDGKSGEPSYPNGEIVRNQIRNPNTALLLIYSLDPVEAKLSNKETPIIGYAISFPGSNFDNAVSYAIHEQLLPIFNVEYGLEDDNENED